MILSSWPRCSTTLERIQTAFNADGGTQVSLADVIVFAGGAAIEKAARDGGVERRGPVLTRPR